MVHGGGPQIGNMLERLAVKSEFIDGLRVTDRADRRGGRDGALGHHQQADRQCHQFGAGGTAIGLSGKDGSLIKAEKLQRRVRDPDSNIEKVLDLGFVGQPSRVNPGILTSMEQAGMIPVIAPIGCRRGRRDLQHQRRHGGRRRRRRRRGGPPGAADRRGGSPE